MHGRFSAWLPVIVLFTSGLTVATTTERSLLCARVRFSRGLLPLP